MKNIYILSALLFVAASCSPAVTKSDSLLQYVDPFVGTTYTGHTFPGATYPFGLMQPGPQTGNFGWEYCSGYRYEDPQIWGFTQTRLNGTGIPDMGDLLVMPFSGTPGDGYKSTFSKATEKASPGYYTVELDDNSVNVQITATPHVAMYKYVFGEDNPAVYIDFQNGQVSSERSYHNRVLFAEVNTEDEYTITGHHKVRAWVERQLFYVIKFDKPVIKTEDIEGAERDKAPKKVFFFDGKKGSKLNVKIAFSTVSIEGAKKNLEAELNHWNFDKVRSNTEAIWEEHLSKVEAEGTTDQKKNLYTSLYHLFIQPNNIADTDGKFRGPTDSVAVSPSGKYYSTFSLWDTYRAAHPMYSILMPDMVPDMVNTMLLHAETYGYLPIWALWGKENYCMIGNHGVPVVVEACLKNFPGIDKERAYNLVKKSLTGFNRKYDWTMYDQYGYFPFDKIREESASRTLECGYDDYCAAMLAKSLNKQDDYEFFMKRSRYYQNLFDPETKLVRGKDSEGNWRTPFDSYHLSHAGTAGGDYTEGNAWQYTWHVQHDVDGLVELMGGKEYFTAKLDSLFILNNDTDQTGFVGDVTGLIGQYAHGNEPSHHVVYLYSMLGKNYRTAELVREVFDKFYQPRPDGLCGNDDCGQMSAWYMFSAFGFYPVNTVNGEYIIGAPQLPKMVLNLAGGKKLTITAANLSDVNKYVKTVTLNGAEIKDYKIRYDQIMNGGELVFEMTDVKM